MEEKEKIITVTGKGNIHVVPDVIRMELLLVSLHDTYQEAYAQGKDNTEKLTAIMKELGLPKTLPKTIRFDIVVSFDAPDRLQVHHQIHEAVQQAFPDYTLQIAMDTDFSE